MVNGGEGEQRAGANLLNEKFAVLNRKSDKGEREPKKSADDRKGARGQSRRQKGL